MIEYMQIYDSDGEQAGLYRFDAEEMTSDQAYEAVDGVAHLFDDRDEFDDSLSELGIKRVYVTVEFCI